MRYLTSGTAISYSLGLKLKSTSFFIIKDKEYQTNLKFPDFSLTLKESDRFPWLMAKFPDFSLIWKNKKNPWLFPDLWQPWCYITDCPPWIKRARKRIVAIKSSSTQRLWWQSVKAAEPVLKEPWTMGNSGPRGCRKFPQDVIGGWKSGGLKVGHYAVVAGRNEPWL